MHIYYIYIIGVYIYIESTVRFLPATYSPSAFGLQPSNERGMVPTNRESSRKEVLQSNEEGEKLPNKTSFSGFVG